MTDLALQINPDNPAQIGTYPPTLPIELALRVAPVKEICAAYGITKEQWVDLCANPVFQRDVAAAIEQVKKEGASVRLKAQLQCDELLTTSWSMIHDTSGNTPPSVRADLLKHTFRVAGFSEPPQGAATNAQTLNIQINL